MSTDVHKFGLSPKGASVVTYRSPALRKFQYHSTVDFAGGRGRHLRRYAAACQTGYRWFPVLVKSSLSSLVHAVGEQVACTQHPRRQGPALEAASLPRGPP
jgi:hypothetical protein